MPRFSSYSTAKRLVIALTALLILAAGCSSGSVDSEPEESGSVSQLNFPERNPNNDDPPPQPTRPPATEPPSLVEYYSTLPPGSALPDSQTCGEQVLAIPDEEDRPENVVPNRTDVAVGVTIDGADDSWNRRFGPRVSGDFNGTTEQMLRWASCKWGFDEDITKARAVTESSWSMSTVGDVTKAADQCDLLGLSAPCPQSYGLLQVKGTVHEGTYPFSSQSTAFGADYAMAWLRACFEGSFTWLAEAGYEQGEEWGCVGAWFSGEWFDQEANQYIAEVELHLEQRSWESFHIRG